MIGNRRILRPRVFALVALAAVLGFAAARPAAAAVPTLMNYQGYLTDNTSTPVNIENFEDSERKLCGRALSTLPSSTVQGRLHIRQNP